MAGRTVSRENHAAGRRKNLFMVGATRALRVATGGFAGHRWQLSDNFRGETSPGVVNPDITIADLRRCWEKELERLVGRARQPVSMFPGVDNRVKVSRYHGSPDTGLRRTNCRSKRSGCEFPCT